MVLKLVIYAIVFTGVFYLANLLYPFLEKKMRDWQAKRIEKIAPRLDNLFLRVPLKRIMFLDVVLPIVIAAVGYIVTKDLLIAAGFGAAGLVIPFVIMKQLEASRYKKFASQLVDGLMILSSSLKAGLSLIQAFEALVEEMPAPISQEFSLVVRQIQMGVSLEDALKTLKRRMRSDELDMVITAITVARETGGNLTEIFMQVSITIQERNRLLGRVNALCVQGKLQGLIMSILPIGFAFFVYQFNPHFFDIFFKDDFGKMLLAYAVISEVLGVIFIRKLSKIDV